METALPVLLFIGAVFITAILFFNMGRSAGYIQASEERWDDIPEDEKPIDPSIN